MSGARLEIAYVAEDYWAGEVFAIAKAGAFSAEGSGWFNPHRIKSGFVDKLRSYPLSSENPPMMAGGVWTYNGEVDECRLRITIKPYDSRGTLLVDIQLTADGWETPIGFLENSATIRFLTEYAAIDRFATELEQVLDAKRDAAVLEGNFR